MLRSLRSIYLKTNNMRTRIYYYSPLFLILIVFTSNFFVFHKTHHHWETALEQYRAFKKNVDLTSKQLTMIHLWLEEGVSGDQSVDTDNVVFYELTKTLKNLKVFLKKTELLEQSRDEIEFVKSRLEFMSSDLLPTLITLADQRLRKPKEGYVGGHLDERFDQQFSGTIHLLDQMDEKLERYLQNQKEERNRRLQFTLTLFIASNFILLFVMYLYIRRFLKEKTLLYEENIMRQRSEAHLEGVIETIPDLIWLKDKNGVYLSCNKKFERFFGASKELIIGKTDYDFVSKEQADFFRKNDQRVLQTNAPCVNEEKIIFADDKHSEILETIKTPLKNESGQVIGVLGIGRDITDRKVAEHSVEKSRQHLLEAQRIAKIGSWELDLTNGCLTWSDEIFQIFEVDKDKFTPSYEFFISRVHPEDREKVDSVYTESLKTKKPYNVRHRLLMPDGRVKIVQEACKSYFDGDNPIRSIGAVQDITNTSLMEKKLQEAYKMDALGQLTGGIAHDYNNLLGVILGYTELLHLHFHQDAKALRYIEQIDKATERGRLMTEKLLSFSRRTMTQAAVIDVNSVIKNDAELLQKALTSEVSLTLELESDPWKVKIEKSELQNALLNMAINAHHAMPKGGELLIKTSNHFLPSLQAQEMGIASGNYLQLTIADTGSGMNEQTLSKVFEPFFSTKGHKGTGLGLSQVFGFVKSSHGAINVTSQPEKGTRFELFFPQHGEEYNALEAKPLNKNGVENCTGTEHILVVDDEPALRNMVKELLSPHGYQVSLAENGEQALTVIEQQKNIALIISDIVMPRMNGIELLNHVFKKYPNIKIQLVNGHYESINQELIDGKAIGPILRKPYRHQELLSRVRQLLDSSKNDNEVNPLDLQTSTASITWSDTFSVGVTELDNDHKQLLSLLNQLIQSFQGKDASQTMESILEKLLDYTSYHFSREEWVMSYCHYPDLERHRQAHRELVEEVNNRISAMNDRRLTPEELIDFLNHWLKEHILGMDKRIYPYIKDNLIEINELLIGQQTP